MQNGGITRRIDGLGRIVIPNEFRKTLHINTGELLEVNLENDRIVLHKHNVFGINDTILSIYVELIKKNYDIDIYITNLEEVIYTTNPAKLDLNEVLKNDKFKKYQINPHGDLLGYIVFDGQSIVDQKILKLSIDLINSLFL